MKSSIECCIFCLGAGMVAGAMIASNNPKVRNWFMSNTKKLTQMYEELKQKIDEKVSCECTSNEKSSSSNAKN